MMTNEQAKILFSKGFKTDDAARAMDSMTLEDRMPHFKINKLDRGERASAQLAEEIKSVFLPRK